jgi:hypothetical protein
LKGDDVQRFSIFKAALILTALTIPIFMQGGGIALVLFAPQTATLKGAAGTTSTHSAAASGSVQASQAGFSNIGKGCTTAYYIDNDCDGYGVGVRTDGDYTTAGNVGDKPDADDNDATVNTAASVLSKYGAIAAFLAAKGYPSTASRIWYVATTGNDTDCTSNPNDAAHPCATTAPFRAAAYYKSGSPGAGGVILYRGGRYTTRLTAIGTGATYLPTAASASSPLVMMSYPGELALIEQPGANFDTSATDAGIWPGNTAIQYVIVDGFGIKSNRSGDCINGNDWKGFTFRNLEVTQCIDGLRATNHIEDFLLENSVFHDNVNHSVYLGYSSPLAVPHSMAADFDFDQDAINYGLKTSKGANSNNNIKNNLFYRDGGGGLEPVHVNTYINGLDVSGNIVHSSGGTGLGFQTGIYNANIYNNLIFNTAACAITFSLYGADPQAATHRWNKIYNNTLWVGDHTVGTKPGMSDTPSCGIKFNDYSGESGVSAFRASVVNGSNLVDWVSGSRFTAYWTPGDIIRFSSVNYVLAEVVDSDTIRLATTYAGPTNSNQLGEHPSTPGHHWIKDFTIANNIIVTDNYSTAQVGFSPFEMWGSSHPNTHTIKNNLLVNNAHAWTSTDIAMRLRDGVSIGGHDPYPTTGQDVGAYTFSQFEAYDSKYTNNATTTDPKFTAANMAWVSSPELFNLRLLTGSPAIDLGSSTGLPPYDLRGTARTALPDAGAYEFTGGDPSPSVPVISFFTATPSRINAGGSSTLSWSVSGATSLVVDQNVGTVTGASVVVSPTRTTTYTLTAINAGGSAISKVTVEVAGAGTLTVVSGNNQSGNVGQALPNPFVVLATDAAGNPASGLGVTFAVASGGGTLSATQTTTNSSGQASTLLILGSNAGTTSVSATATGLTGSPLTFTANAITSAGAALTWVESAIVGPWPFFRGYNILTYDPVLKRTLLATSENGTTIYSNSYWSYSAATHTWRQETTTGLSGQCVLPLGSNPPNHPANRHPYHGQAYDTRRGQMYLFGGVCQGAPFGDTWAYQSSTNTWSQMSPSSHPTARTETAMAYDAAHDAVVLYGGLAPYTQSSDSWHYSPNANTWTKASPATAPGPIAAHSMVYDSVNQKIVLFGGYKSSGTPLLNGTWIYDAGTQTWSNPNPGISPPGLKFPPLTFDSKRGLVVLYTGSSHLWTYNVATNQWSQLPVTGGPAATDRAGSPCPQCLTMAYDESTDKLILTSQSSSYRTATWELSLGTLSLDPYDLNSDGIINIVDTQLAVKQVLGIATCSADFDGDGRCTAIDIQMIVNKAIAQ